MSEKKSLLVVDDHPMFRQGLVTFLSQTTGFEIIGEAANGHEGLTKARQLKPDLVLMDISLPDMNGIDVTRQILSSNPGIKVIILSMHSKIDFITDAFKAGASGYITKETTGEKLIECLETVGKGEYYMDTAISQEVIKNILIDQQSAGKIRNPGYSSLTPREQEIMILIAEGRSTKQIASKLFISQKTVENHRASIFNKLNVHNTMELMRYAAKYGLIDIDLWKS